MILNPGSFLRIEVMRLECKFEGVTCRAILSAGCAPPYNITLYNTRYGTHAKPYNLTPGMLHHIIQHNSDHETWQTCINIKLGPCNTRWLSYHPLCHSDETIKYHTFPQPAIQGIMPCMIKLA